MHSTAFSGSKPLSKLGRRALRVGYKQRRRTCKYSIPATQDHSQGSTSSNHVHDPLFAASERDGGHSASTSTSTSPSSGVENDVSAGAVTSTRLKLQLRRPGQRDWLLLLDEASLPQGLSKKAPRWPGSLRGPQASKSGTFEPSEPTSSSGSSSDSSGGSGGILRAVSRASSLAALLPVVEQHGSSIRSHEVAATLEAAVRLLRAPPTQPQQQREVEEASPASSSGSLAGAPAAEARGQRQDQGPPLDRLVQLLLQRISGLGVSSFSASDLLQVASCCAKLQQHVAVDLRSTALAAAAGLASSLSDANMHELTRLIWALATLRCLPPPDWLDAFCRCSQAHFHAAAVAPSHLTLTAWSLARLGYNPPEPWVAALLDESEPLLGAATGRNLANITWALGMWKPRCVPESWLSSLYHASAQALPTMSGVALSQLAWGLGQARITPPPAWLDALTATAVNAATSTGAVRQPSDSGDIESEDSASSEAPSNSSSGIPSAGGDSAVLSGIQMVNVLWLLARCRHRPPAPVMGALMESARASCLVGPQGGPGSPTDLSTLLWSSARLGYLPSEAWLDDWLATAEGCMRAGRYAPSHYATAALELGRWGVVPTASWRNMFFRSCRPRLPQFTLQQLATLVWGLGRMRAPVPSSWLFEFVQAGTGKLASSHVQAADVGRLMGGLARVRPELPRGHLEDGWDNGSSSEDEGEQRSRGVAAGAGHHGVRGMATWAGDNWDVVQQLMLAVIPFLPGCGPRELWNVALAAGLFRVGQPAAFKAALRDAADRLQQAGQLTEGCRQAVQASI